MRNAMASRALCQRLPPRSDDDSRKVTRATDGLFLRCNMALITPQKAGETVGVSPALIYRWCQEQRLPHYRCGGEGKRGKILIDPGDLDEFMRACRVEPHGLLDDLE